MRDTPTTDQRPLPPEKLFRPADLSHLEFESEQPYKAIIDTAKTSGCDLIAMASHGRRGVFPRQRHEQGADAQLHTRPRLSLKQLTKS